MTDPVPSKCIAAGCTNDAIGPSVLCMRHYVLPAGEPVPSKDVISDLRAALELLDGRSNYNPSGSRRSTILTNAIHDFTEATMRKAVGELDRLQTALSGIQSCSTCEACRGAATRALGGAAPEPEVSCEEWPGQAKYKSGPGGNNL